MSKAQKKLEKRKVKERATHRQILNRRTAIRAEAKEKREEFRDEKKHRKMIRQVEEMQAVYDQMKDKLPPETRQKIERNIEILSALEQQFVKETEERKKNNEQLETEGALSMKEKMNLLEKKMLENGTLDKPVLQDLEMQPELGYQGLLEAK